MTDLRVRDVDDDVVEEIRKRARRNQRSVEGELRAMLEEAVGRPAQGLPTADDWARAGFSQVSELVPGRQFEVWAESRHFRILVTRPILTGSSVAWNTSIDECVVVDDPDEPSGWRYVWTSPAGIPARHLGATPALALFDAMRWLADWAGFDEKGLARRDAALAALMHEELREVVDRVDQLLEDLDLDTWRNDQKARWTGSEFEVFLTRSGDELVMMTYPVRETRLLEARRFRMEKASADAAAAAMRLLFEDDGLGTVEA